MKYRNWTIGWLAVWAAACGGANSPSDSASETTRTAGTVEDGEALIEKGDFEGAAAVFKDLADSSPDAPKVFYYLALAQKNLGDSKAAIKNYEKASALDPALMDAHINLGLMLLEKGDLARAESELRIYLENSPDASDAHFNYALVQEALGNLEKATAHYEKAAAAAPEDFAPLLGLGDAAKKSGNAEAALDYYRKARAVAPAAAEPVFAEGEMLLEMKQTQEACRTFSLLPGLSLESLPWAVEAGKRLAAADPDCATAIYRAAVNADDTFAAAHFYLANALARDKDFARAARHFERFLSLAPNDPAASEARRRLDICKAQIK
jgi:tetratricopeptide (TPR) repeat protein